MCKWYFSVGCPHPDLCVCLRALLVLLLILVGLPGIHTRHTLFWLTAARAGLGIPDHGHCSTLLVPSYSKHGLPCYFDRLLPVWAEEPCEHVLSTLSVPSHSGRGLPVCVNVHSSLCCPDSCQPMQPTSACCSILLVPLLWEGLDSVHSQGMSCRFL